MKSLRGFSPSVRKRPKKEMLSYGAFEHSGIRKSGLRGGMEVNEVPLCSTGNCIQYPVINHHGKEHD